tara:strand:- start:3576 stop:6005 length:2430 start_codon:yes stop_codon:yes gene_type:complete
MAKEKFTSISLHQEMQRSYLEYAMSVIVGRALPDARDGLKPVQRRILFAMQELGLTPERPFRKCARVVGDVLGKYHPHGDQAVYDALVRLVQDFSTKYPILDGHGNFGSVDDDPPAAMRYTETRLAPIASEALLQEIEYSTVSFSDNFDGSQQEPDVLPAQLPFLLLNGSSGIAVGMATNIPPHNLGEIVDALTNIIDKPDISEKELNEIVLGPDFPTGGELIYTENIKDVYSKGRGSITIRGVIHPEEIHMGKGKHKRNALVITELPYQISKSGWIEKLADLVNNSKINGISDIRDESDREGMRIIIELKRDINPDLIISDLFKKTALQTNFGAIFLALVDGKPIQLSLKEYLKIFISFREETIVKRTKYHLKITTDKLEVLQGLSLAINNIKKIIEIVQNSENIALAKNTLINEINLSEKQSEAVLSMPIKKLTTLERLQINKDIKILIEKKEVYINILSHRKVLLRILKKELLDLKKKFNIKRKTKLIKNINPINQLETVNKQILEEFINKNVKLSIDENFYFKKLFSSNFKKLLDTNHKITTNKCSFKIICNINENMKLIALTHNGKIVNIDWKKGLDHDYKLDKKFLNNINPSEIRNFHSFNEGEENYLCILNQDGRFKKILLNESMIKSNRVFSILKFSNENKIIDSFIAKQENLLIIITSIGRIFKFNLSNKNIFPTSKQSQGVLITKLLPQEKIISCCKSKIGDEIIITTKKGKFYSVNNNDIYDSYSSKLGYINHNFKVTSDCYLKIFSGCNLLDIKTDQGRFARIDLSKIIINKKSNKIESLEFLNNEKINDLYLIENN